MKTTWTRKAQALFDFFVLDRLDSLAALFNHNPMHILFDSTSALYQIGFQQHARCVSSARQSKIRNKTNRGVVKI